MKKLIAQLLTSIIKTIVLGDFLVAQHLFLLLKCLINFFSHWRFMQVLRDEPSFKLVAIAGTKIMFIRLPSLCYINKAEKIVPICLDGIGNTATHKSLLTPWLVTVTLTRTSYIIYQEEAIGVSYVQEKLHVYDKALAKKVATAISNVFSKYKPQ